MERWKSKGTMSTVRVSRMLACRYGVSTTKVGTRCESVLVRSPGCGILGVADRSAASDDSTTAELLLTRVPSSCMGSYSARHGLFY